MRQLDQEVAEQIVLGIDIGEYDVLPAHIAEEARDNAGVYAGDSLAEGYPDQARFAVNALRSLLEKSRDNKTSFILHAGSAEINAQRMNADNGTNAFEARIELDQDLAKALEHAYRVPYMQREGDNPVKRIMKARLGFGFYEEALDIALQPDRGTHYESGRNLDRDYNGALAVYDAQLQDDSPQTALASLDLISQTIIDDIEQFKFSYPVYFAVGIVRRYLENDEVDKARSLTVNVMSDFTNRAVRLESIGGHENLDHRMQDELYVLNAAVEQNGVFQRMTEALANSELPRLRQLAAETFLLGLKIPRMQSKFRSSKGVKELTLRLALSHKFLRTHLTEAVRSGNPEISDYLTRDSMDYHISRETSWESSHSGNWERVHLASRQDEERTPLEILTILYDAYDNGPNIPRERPIKI